MTPPPGFRSAAEPPCLCSSYMRRWGQGAAARRLCGAAGASLPAHLPPGACTVLGLPALPNGLAEKLPSAPCSGWKGSFGVCLRQSGRPGELHLCAPGQQLSLVYPASNCWRYISLLFHPWTFLDVKGSGPTLAPRSLVLLQRVLAWSWTWRPPLSAASGDNGSVFWQSRCAPKRPCLSLMGTWSRSQEMWAPRWRSTVRPSCPGSQERSNVTPHCPGGKTAWPSPTTRFTCRTPLPGELKLLKQPLHY